MPVYFVMLMRSMFVILSCQFKNFIFFLMHVFFASEVVLCNSPGLQAEHYTFNICVKYSDFISCSQSRHRPHTGDLFN